MIFTTPVQTCRAMVAAACASFVSRDMLLVLSSDAERPTSRKLARSHTLALAPPPKAVWKSESMRNASTCTTRVGDRQEDL